jgi:hypothetical protein
LEVGLWTTAFIPHPSSPTFKNPSSSKALGQNFLVNEGVVKRIIDELAPTE